MSTREGRERSWACRPAIRGATKIRADLCFGKRAEKMQRIPLLISCLAPWMEGESMRATHNWPVLLKLASAYNDSIVHEADIHSSECTPARQTPIVSSEWSKKGSDECLFFRTQTASMNIYLGCSLQTLTGCRFALSVIS